MSPLVVEIRKLTVNSHCTVLLNNQDPRAAPSRWGKGGPVKTSKHVQSYLYVGELFKRREADQLVNSTFYLLKGASIENNPGVGPVNPETGSATLLGVK